MGKVAILVGDSNAESNAKAWHWFEVQQWCDAAQQRGLKLDFLDPLLRADCNAELSRRTAEGVKKLPDRS